MYNYCRKNVKLLQIKHIESIAEEFIETIAEKVYWIYCRKNLLELLHKKSETIAEKICNYRRKSAGFFKAF